MKFAIDNICEPENVYLVTGVCYEDIEREKYLKIGDVFLKAYKNIYKKTSEGNYKPVEQKDIRNVKLQVKKIIAYRHFLEELYSGMTAAIYLVGKGATTLENKDILSTNN